MLGIFKKKVQKYKITISSNNCCHDSAYYHLWRVRELRKVQKFEYMIYFIGYNSEFDVFCKVFKEVISQKEVVIKWVNRIS